MIAHPKTTHGYRDRARVFPLAALALAGLGLAACSGTPQRALEAQAAVSTGTPAPRVIAAPAPAPRAAAALPLDPRRDFARLAAARAGSHDRTRPAEIAGAALPYRVVARSQAVAQRDFERLTIAQAARPAVEPSYDRLQLASAAVSSEELQSHRGGFVTVDGIQVDFAFEQVSMLNDLEQITSRITLADMIAGNPGTVTVGGVTTSGSGTVTITGADGGATQITHNVLPSTINTVFANTASGISASNTVNLTIDIIGIDTVRVGHRVGTRPMNLEIRNALIHSLGN